MGLLRGRGTLTLAASALAAGQGACSLITPLDFIGGGDGGGAPADAALSASDAAQATTDGGGPSDASSESSEGGRVASVEGGADSTGTADSADAPACQPATLGSDPHNCGACGHDCLGGACDAGACQPVMLATGLGGVQHMAIDADNLYVTRWNGSDETDGSIIQIPKNGGLSNRLTQWQVNPDGIAVDDTYVYWANFGPASGGAGSVAKVVKSGGTATVVAAGQSSNGHGSFVVAVDGTSIYWGNYFQVMICPLSGCSGAGSDASAGQELSTAGGVSAIAAAGGVVYWTEGDGAQVSMIASTNLGGAPTPLASGQPRPAGLALDSSFAYWTNSAGGTIYRAALGGGQSPQLVATSRAAEGSTDSLGYMAVDEANVYWIDATAQSIMKAPKVGGPATPIVNFGGADCRDVKVDSTAVYWSCFFSGYVAKIAK
ncbi:MAG TPA: hypothetical protein VE987_20980 [Polyangiaceae bacterium]|nr:hypothetical protein [Polyangiaceae bacterium]